MKARERKKEKEKKRDGEGEKTLKDRYRDIERKKKTDTGSIRKRQEDLSSVTVAAIKKGFTKPRL